MAKYADLTAHVKPFLEIGAADTTHNALLTMLLEDAVATMDRLLNVDSLERATYVDERFDGGVSKIYTRNFPIVSVTSIKQGKAETLYTQTEDYIFTKNELILDGVCSGGKEYEQNKITYVAGYITYEQDAAGGAFEGQGVTLPNDLRRACVLLVAAAYNTRQNEGVKSFTMQGQTVTLRNDDEAKEFERIMNRYKKPIIKEV